MPVDNGRFALKFDHPSAASRQGGDRHSAPAQNVCISITGPKRAIIIHHIPLRRVVQSGFNPIELY